MKKVLNFKNIIITSIIALLACFIFYSIIMSPAMGKADNGDFCRIMNSIGVSDLSQNYDEIYDGWFHKIYKTDSLIDSLKFFLPWQSSWTISCWMAKIAFVLNFIVNIFNFGYFDIRCLGFIYTLIFLNGVYLILKYDKISNFTRIVLGIYIILFFTDGIYLSYFNSFFGEAAEISCIFLLIGSFLYLISRKEPSKKDFLFFYVSSFCFLTSKTQMLPLLLFMWIIYFGLYKFYPDFKKTIIKSSIIVTLLCALTFVSIGNFTNLNNKYQAVFTGILYNSDTVEQDLQELGLDTKFASLAGTGFYEENLEFDPLGDEMMEEFYPNVSFMKVFLFYLKHPSRAWQQIKASAESAYNFYPIDEENFEKGQDSSSKLINRFRYNLIQEYPEVHKNIYVYIGFSFIYLIFIGVTFFKTKNKEKKLLMLILLFLLASGASQLVLPVLGSGFADFSKHLFFISIGYDILVGTALVFICNTIAGKIKFYYMKKKGSKLYE